MVLILLKLRAPLNDEISGICPMLLGCNNNNLRHLPNDQRMNFHKKENKKYWLSTLDFNALGGTYISSSGKFCILLCENLLFL